MIKAIFAADEKFGIGRDGRLPWHLPEDLDLFKKTTIGNGENIIIMGRKTKESITSFPLQGRINMVLTSNPTRVDEVSNWNQVLELSEMCEDLFIVGGATLYNHALENKYIKQLYISKVKGDFNCDTFVDSELIKDNYEQVEQTEYDNFSFTKWVLKD